MCLMANCGKKAKTTVEVEEKVEQVKTLKLQSRTIQRHIKVSGNLEGYETVHISPTTLNSIIEKIYVEVGSKVKKGDMLVRMDQTQYNNAKINLANLKTDLERYKALLKSGSISQQVYDQTKMAYDQAKENIGYLKENTFVKAPKTGVISVKNHEAGELYNGAKSIVDLVEIDKLKIIISVAESYLPYIKEGMRLSVSSEVYPNVDFEGKIEIVYPTIDPSTHTFHCKVVIANTKRQLKPGMYVTTTINIGDVSIIAVPYQSVEKLVGSNERYVFLNKDGRALRVPVKLGQRIDEDIEIIAPEIVEGAEYVYVGQHRLVDGVKLNVVE